MDDPLILRARLFDDVRFHDNWAFARVRDGYVGIHSVRGLAINDEGRYAGRELVCTAPDKVWLVECGRRTDWGSFDRYVAGLSAARITEHAGTVTYESPSAGAFVTGWDTRPSIAGEPVRLRDYPMVDSPWAYSAFGSPELTIRYRDEVYDAVFI